MKDRVSVTLPSRQERLAKALAALIMGVGILLITVAFIFQPPSIQQPVNPLQTSGQNESEPATARTQPIVSAVISTSTTVAEEQIPAEHTRADVEAPPESTTLPVEENIPEPAANKAPEEPTQRDAETSPDSEQLAQTESDQTPQTTQTKEEPKQSAPTPTEDTNTSDKASGWIYAGQFLNGRWLERALVIGDELPTNGNRYTLSWETHVRTDPPSKNKPLSQTVANLSQGQQIEVIQVKKSGNKGHIWLKIKQ